MTAIALTDAVIKALPTPPKGNKIYYDASPAGFGVRVTAAGFRSFIFNYRVRGSGRERRHTIGNCLDWSVGAARKEARRLKQLVGQGEDPLGAIQDERKAPTINDLCDRFIEEHILPKTRQGTAKAYQGHIRRHIRSTFGNWKVTDVAFADVERLHRKLTTERGKYAANRTIATLTVMFSQAVKWRLREDNPCRGIGMNKENKRKRYLRDDELQRLLAVLANHSNQEAANIVRTLLLSGARVGEVLSMKWEHLNVAEGTWLKPAATVKQGEDHDVPLAAPLRQLLANVAAGQKRRGITSDYVFPGRSAGAHYGDLWLAWQDISRAAGIPGVRIHDLRHSFASILASSSVSLPVIGALLGHANATTTERYAHLFKDAQRAAAERVGDVIANAGKDVAPPTPIRRKS
jgi:integrase